jgi:5-methyltetrahydrofolate--homocysteine methyltransferase
MLVGELINASRSSIARAIEAGDREAILAAAQSQADAGVDFIDVNAGVFVGREAEYLRWLVEAVQSEAPLACCLDSPDPDALAAALGVHRGTPMINSISMESERLNGLLPLIAGTDFKVIALCMSDAGMPVSADDRLTVADDLINTLVRNGVALENIYVDPLVQPVSLDGNFGAAFLDAVREIMIRFEGVHTICGLSNISYGLPGRRLLNRLFAVMAVANGLDGLILDPLDPRMMAFVTAAATLAGRDEFCENYLNAFRGGKLDV